MPELTLRHDALSLVVSPEAGGALLAFRHGDFDLFHPTAADAARNHTLFPLVPFSGRIDDARFTFAGRSYTVPPNFPPEPHAIHGVGWQLPWRVAAQDAASLTLALDDARDGDAFRLDGTGTFRLGPDTLEVELAVTNRGSEPMPFGLGLHPYFERGKGALLSAEVTGIWLPDTTNIPRRLEPVPLEKGFGLRRPVDELAPLDHNFQGWSGGARVEWPAAGLALVTEADALFRHLVVYVPNGKPYFCVEPASMVADGFNMLARGVEGTGVRVLAPGATLKGAVRFRVESVTGV